ncbi:hypothetical protein VTK26DRAFT_6030 [Humicola hyalothermophila]
MGNSQSAEVPPRAPQKLSKPKTGKHATAGLLSPGSYSKSSRRLSNAVLPSPQLSASLTAASTPTTASAVEEAPAEFDGCLLDNRTSSHPDLAPRKRSRRWSLFRSRSSQGAAGPSNGSGTGMVERLARVPSMTYESAVAYYGPANPENQPVPCDPRTSWNYNITSYEAKRLLNLAEEPGLGRTRAMSETTAPTITETTWKSSNPANSPNAPITRSSSYVSLYMPVRRRSIIQTPGVATRSVSVQDNPLPQVNLRHSHPASPCLSRQQSFESLRSGIMSMPPRIQDSESVPRVATPCDEQYRSIGTFKLGSLRITNGSPSPASPELSRDRGAEGPGVGEGIVQDGQFLGAPLLETGANSNLQNCDNSLSERSQPRPASPALQTTSKATAVEDQLFDDETQAEYSSVEVLDVRLDPNAKSFHSQAERDRNNTVSRTDSGFESTASPSSELAYKPLAKADSGYSSNASLRSFHAKTQGPEDQGPSSELRKQELSSGAEALHSPEREVPPPVPPKDAPRRFPVVQPKLNIPTGQGTSAGSLREKRTTVSTATRHVPTPIVNPQAGSGGAASPKSMPRTPGSLKSPTSSNSNPDSNTAPGQPKPGRLQRLLGATRRPIAGQPVQTQYTPKHDTIPPPPRQAGDRLHGFPRALPTRTRRLALGQRASLDTLKTILSVGSVEGSLDAVNSVKTSRRITESETKEDAWKQALHSVPPSIAEAAAHVIPPKPINHKPVPVLQKVGNKRDRSGSFAGFPSCEDLESDARPGPCSQTLRERTLSLTLPRKRSMNLDSPVSSLDLASSAVDLPAPPVPSPVAKAMSMETRPAPCAPINPTVRRPLSLRVPPPLRARSSTASLSRRTSRESMGSYTTSHHPTRKSSMESFHSYSASQRSIANGSVHSQSPTGPTMDPRRFQSFRNYQGSPSSPYGSPNWDVQQEHATARQTPQPSLTGVSRRNSISSVHTDGAYGIHHPSSDHEWLGGTTAHHPLRHQASYDGYSHQQPHPRDGYPPSMSNGYTAPAVRPWPSSSTSSYDPRNRGQRDAAAGQWCQDDGGHNGGDYPPYVPRGGPHHYRNRSMGNRTGWYGPNPPFRVLHSYNSPAYRNVPIWG